MQTTQKMSFAGDHFLVGVDTHLKNWKVTIRLDGLELKTFSINLAPLELVASKNIIPTAFTISSMRPVSAASGRCRFSGRSTLTASSPIPPMYLLPTKKK